jgi:hypothetical protein
VVSRFSAILAVFDGMKRPETSLKISLSDKKSGLGDFGKPPAHDVPAFRHSMCCTIENIRFFDLGTIP